MARVWIIMEKSDEVNHKNRYFFVKFVFDYVIIS